SAERHDGDPLAPQLAADQGREDLLRELPLLVQLALQRVGVPPGIGEIALEALLEVPLGGWDHVVAETDPDQDADRERDEDGRERFPWARSSWASWLVPTVFTTWCGNPRRSRRSHPGARPSGYPWTMSSAPQRSASSLAESMSPSTTSGRSPSSRIASAPPSTPTSTGRTSRM